MAEWNRGKEIEKFKRKNEDKNGRQAKIKREDQLVGWVESGDGDDEDDNISNWFLSCYRCEESIEIVDSILELENLNGSSRT